MAQLARDHGIRSIHIEDDYFLRDRGRVLELCELLRAEPLPVIWELLNGVRPDQVDAELLATMAAAGCRRLVFSFEHIAPTPGAEVGHGWAVARQAVQAARAAEMRIGGYLMLGLPGRDLAETLRSIAYTLRLRLDYAKFTPYWFAPGSPHGAARGHLEGTCLSPAVVRNISRVAELGFFTQPRIAAALLRDVAEDPQAARTLLHRAWELLRAGGPVPMRDTP